MDVGKFNSRSLYTVLRFDYRHRLWTPTSPLRTISAVAELLVTLCVKPMAPVRQFPKLIYAIKLESESFNKN